GSLGDPKDKDDITSEDESISVMCKYMDFSLTGSEKVIVKFPMPLVSDRRLGSTPVPATSVRHPAAAIFLSGGPAVDLTVYTKADEGTWIGDDYVFNVMAYKDMTTVLGGILGGGAAWKFSDIVGPRLVEAEYLVTIQNAKSPSCKAVVESIPVTRGDLA